jgi:hypothetical protein
MTPTIGDGEQPAEGNEIGDGEARDGSLSPARRGGVSVEARQGWTLPAVMRSAPMRLVSELATFAVGLLILRLTTATPTHVTISVYGELWPALPLLLFWKAINRLLKP